MLLAAASKEFSWNLNMGAISLMWRVSVWFGFFHLSNFFREAASSDPAS
jgi:6-phosphogluconate dehydrogenase